MPPSSGSRRALRFALALAALVVAVGVGAAAGCGPYDVTEVWVCLGPNGKDDPSVYDANHYVMGVFDPCHCFDPCGPAQSCPITVDAGPPAPGCDAGDGGS